MSDLFDGVKRNTKRNTTRITDYDLLHQYIRSWADGRGHHSLVVLGRPGILKSSLVKAVVDPDKGCLYVEGFTGPLALFRDLFLKQNMPVVLDDIQITEQLRPILQPLWDNYNEHTIRWATAKPPKVYIEGNNDDQIVAGDDDNKDGDDPGASGGEDDGQIITLPSQFKTVSRCLLLTNSIERLLDMPALLDRAYIIEFDPSVADVLDRAKAFLDEEIWRWGKQHEALLPNISVRDLVQAGTDKRIGMPWEKLLRGRYLEPRSKLGAYLEVIADKSLATGEQRVERWMRMTEKDRATYFRVQKDYRELFPTKALPRGRSATLRLKKDGQSRKVAANKACFVAGQEQIAKVRPELAEPPPREEPVLRPAFTHECIEVASRVAGGGK